MSESKKLQRGNNYVIAKALPKGSTKCGESEAPTKHLEEGAQGGRGRHSRSAGIKARRGMERTLVGSASSPGTADRRAECSTTRTSLGPPQSVFFSSVSTCTAREGLKDDGYMSAVSVLDIAPP